MRLCLWLLNLSASCEFAANIVPGWTSSGPLPRRLISTSLQSFLPPRDWTWSGTPLMSSDPTLSLSRAFTANGRAGLMDGVKRNRTLRCRLGVMGPSRYGTDMLPSPCPDPCLPVGGFKTLDAGFGVAKTRVHLHRKGLSCGSKSRPKRKGSGSLHWCSFGMANGAA